MLRIVNISKKVVRIELPYSKSIELHHCITCDTLNIGDKGENPRKIALTKYFYLYRMSSENVHVTNLVIDVSPFY